MQGLLTDDLAAQNFLHRSLPNEGARLKRYVLVAGGEIFVSVGFLRLFWLLLNCPLACSDVRCVAFAEGELAALLLGFLGLFLPGRRARGSSFGET